MSKEQPTLLHETTNSYLYLTEEAGFDRPIILKVLKAEHPSPQRIIQFNNEFEFTKGLDLPGVRRAFSSEKRDGRFTLLLEYIDGVTLKEAFLENEQPLKFFLQTAIRTSDALQQLHSQGVIHKDINSRNVLLNLTSGKVTLIDFGISSKIDLKTPHLGNPDKLEGSLAYISPEQTGRMNRVVDYRTDLYSLGVTFYEMLTKQLPFRAKDSLEMVHAHIARTPNPVSEVNSTVPATLSRIVKKLMAKNAEDRYQSAYGLKVDLEQCLDEWEDHKKISDFELGQHDLSDRFHIPQQLYGREEELEKLMGAFGRAASGGLELMLVAGYSGVGKTALIHEVHKPITEKRGYFIEGKYDQYQRNIPYFAIREAFDKLCDLLLTESNEVLAGWRERILAAVGTNGQVIIDIIPNLEGIIGPQPPVEQLEPQESMARFNMVFQSFLRSVSQSEHPLTLFIDDLQWADNASLKLLKVLLTDEKNQYLLLLGAYRDNETDPNHPLMVMLSELEKEKATYSSIRLGPLTAESVEALTADTLNDHSEQAAELAALIFSKTQGNAFFTVEFLRSLKEKKLIQFDPEKHSWTADLDQIKKLDITDNVVELMAGKITTLPSEVQEVLRYASCIGARFDLRALAVILEKTPLQTLGSLWQAVEDGLVLPENDNYKLLTVTATEEVDFEMPFEFLHDRVQQAAYSLIGEEERQATHWRIGNMILEKASELDEQVFDVVNQLNAGRSMAKTNTERIRLCELNLRAGKQAKQASAELSAQNYLDISLEMLTEKDWEKNYGLAFDVHRTAAEVCYLTGQLEHSESLTEICLAKAKTPLEQADIYYILMLRQSLSNRYEEAIDTARKGLSLLDFDFPKDDLEQHVGTNMGWLVTWFQEHGVDGVFDHPEMTEPEKLAIIKILDNLSMPTYVSGQVNLWIVHVLLKVKLSIEHGNTPETGYAFVELGLIFCILENWEMAFASGELARRLAEKYEQRSLRHKCRTFHLYANYISPWRMHYRDTLPFNNESYRTGLASGEVIFVGYTLFHPFYNQFFAGDPPLQTLLDRTEAGILSAKKIRMDLAFNCIRGMRMFLLNLTDQRGDATTFEDENLTEEKFLGECMEWKDFYSVCTYQIFKAKILFLYRQYEAAQEALEQAKPMLAAMSGNAAGLGTYTFMQALVALELSGNASQEEQKNYSEIVEAGLSQYRTWAENCPDNFAQQLHLIEAEKAKVEGRALEAVGFYNQAIAAAQQSNYLGEEALANELAARFLLKNNVPQYARPHLREAYQCYARWGAVSKVRLLEEEFPYLRTPETSRTSSLSTTTIFSTSTSQSTEQELDLVSIVKASQTLAGEIVLEKLLNRMMEIVLENAGAQRAVLVSKREDDWYVEAVGDVEQKNALLPNELAEQTQPLPNTVLHFLQHTKATLVIDDAREDARFSRDEYLVKNQPLSILGMPLMHQSKMQGILYLENRLTTAAFPAHRVETLRLLSSQMVVSLQNAHLYDRQQELVQAYARFVPREFLRTLGHESILDVQLGDQVAQNMTVLFSDIRDYTSLSETMTPEENFNFINGYLKRIGPNITQNEGFINQYFGDGIMALFPDPENAVKAAIGMQRDLSVYNKLREAKGRIPIRMGIGVHTGNLMLGIIGDEKRHDVGVISDVVNCASRIEGLTKYFGVSILVTEDAVSEISHLSEYDHRFLGRVQVKGKEGIVAVYEFFGGDMGKMSQKKKETVATFQQGMEDYFNKKFAEAALYLRKTLDENPEDKVAEHYLRKAAMYLVGGVEDDWTGVERMSEK